MSNTEKKAEQSNQLKRTTGENGLRCSTGWHSTDAAASECRGPAVTPASHSKLSCIPKRDRTAMLVTSRRLSVLTFVGILFSTFTGPARKTSRERRGEFIISNPKQFTRKINNQSTIPARRDSKSPSGGQN